jgi:type 1 fimbria pilin
VLNTHDQETESKLINLNKKGGSVAFGDDSSTKILGKGIVKKNKDEVLLSATCSGGATPKKKVTFFH